MSKCEKMISCCKSFSLLQKLKVGKPQGDEREGSAEVEASNLENYMVMITLAGLYVKRL